MNNNTAVVVAILSGLMGLLGVALGACLTGLREAWSRKKRHLSYWSAMHAEVDVCREFGEFYLKDEKTAPLYRPREPMRMLSRPYWVTDRCRNKKRAVSCGFTAWLIRSIADWNTRRRRGTRSLPRKFWDKRR